MQTKTNKWAQAQKKECNSWLDTDMTFDYLIENWESRRKNFKFIIDKINKNSSVLDVGSGPVSVLHIFPQCKTMVAVDSLNDQYKKKYKRMDHIQYFSSKAERLDFSNESFDFITCINALDHVDDYCKSLNEIIRCLKPGGCIYLEYENTSPLSIFLSKLGYKKPLNDFHPILVKNKRVLQSLKQNNFKILKINCRPQFSLNKIKAIYSIFFTKKKITTYEKNISVLNYGIAKSIFHYFIIFIERLLFFLFPVNFGYFTIIIAKKHEQFT